MNTNLTPRVRLILIALALAGILFSASPVLAAPPCVDYCTPCPADCNEYFVRVNTYMDGNLLPREVFLSLDDGGVIRGVSGQDIPVPTTNVVTWVWITTIGQEWYEPVIFEASGEQFDHVSGDPCQLFRLSTEFHLSEPTATITPEPELTPEPETALVPDNNDSVVLNGSVITGSAIFNGSTFSGTIIINNGGNVTINEGNSSPPPDVYVDVYAPVNNTNIVTATSSISSTSLTSSAAVVDLSDDDVTITMEQDNAPKLNKIRKPMHRSTVTPTTPNLTQAAIAMWWNSQSWIHDQFEREPWLFWVVIIGTVLFLLYVIGTLSSAPRTRWP